MAGISDAVGPTVYSLIMKVGLGLIIIIIMAVLFFASKYGFAAYRRYKNYKVKAVIFNPDGSWFIRRIGKFRTSDNIDKMLFMGSTETMPVIPPKYIRNNTVALWRYDVGQYAVIPPKVFEKLDPSQFGIEVINMQQKNFAFLEQRAAVSRWSYIKDALAKWAPFITILMLVVAAGVIAWFMLKTAGELYNSATAARTAECMKLLGSGTPTG